MQDLSMLLLPGNFMGCQFFAGKRSMGLIIVIRDMQKEVKDGIELIYLI